MRRRDDFHLIHLRNKGPLNDKNVTTALSTDSVSVEATNEALLLVIQTLYANVLRAIENQKW